MIDARRDVIFCILVTFVSLTLWYCIKVPVSFCFHYWVVNDKVPDDIFLLESFLPLESITNHSASPSYPGNAFPSYLHFLNETVLKK